MNELTEQGIESIEIAASVNFNRVYKPDEKWVKWFIDELDQKWVKFNVAKRDHIEQHVVPADLVRDVIYIKPLPRRA